jgi:ankyrin repeat protein
LHIAAERGSLDVLKFCLSKQLDVNAQTRHCQETPLHLAVQEGQTDAVKELLAAGADVMIANCEVCLSFPMFPFV